jgi:hypothetical protein
LADAQAVAFAEEREMNEKRIELVSVTASLGVPGCQRRLLEVDLEGAAREPSEQLHHGEIHFTVPAVNGRVQEDRSSRFIPEKVAAPQVSVEEGDSVGFPSDECRPDFPEDVFRGIPIGPIECAVYPRK